MLCALRTTDLYLTHITLQADPPVPIRHIRPLPVACCLASFFLRAGVSFMTNHDSGCSIRFDGTVPRAVPRIIPWTVPQNGAPPTVARRRATAAAATTVPAFPAPEGGPWVDPPSVLNPQVQHCYIPEQHVHVKVWPYSTS